MVLKLKSYKIFTVNHFSLYSESMKQKSRCNGCEENGVILQMSFSSLNLWQITKEIVNQYHLKGKTVAIFNI